jgi:hypothetical protein
MGVDQQAVVNCGPHQTAQMKIVQIDDSVDHNCPIFAKLLLQMENVEDRGYSFESYPTGR